LVVCDICGSPETGTLVSSGDMSMVVFKKSFNPFALDLVRSFITTYIAFEGGKTTIVAKDNSHWNIWVAIYDFAPRFEKSCEEAS